MKINFLDALVTLVGRVDAGWLPKHASVNANGLPNARKFPFVGLQTTAVLLEIESGYSGSTLMMKTDSEVTTFNNGRDYFPSRYIKPITLWPTTNNVGHLSVER